MMKMMVVVAFLLACVNCRIKCNKLKLSSSSRAEATNQQADPGQPSTVKRELVEPSTVKRELVDEVADPRFQSEEDGWDKELGVVDWGDWDNEPMYPVFHPEMSFEQEKLEESDDDEWGATPSNQSK